MTYQVPESVPRCKVCGVPLSATYFNLAAGYPYLPGETIRATDRPDVVYVWRHLVTNMDDLETLAYTPIHWVEV